MSMAMCACVRRIAESKTVGAVPISSANFWVIEYDIGSPIGDGAATVEHMNAVGEIGGQCLSCLIDTIVTAAKLRKRQQQASATGNACF
jgi:hypothetical protein